MSPARIQRRLTNREKRPDRSGTRGTADGTLSDGFIRRRFKREEVGSFRGKKIDLLPLVEPKPTIG